MPSITFKRRFAGWLKRFSFLRWGLRLGVKLFVSRHHVGAVGVVFNAAGQILLVEHVFRPHHAWGLPGGWIERGESPADAVRRELKEELKLRVEVKRLLLCEPQGDKSQSSTPPGLGLAFYCRLVDEERLLDNMATAPTAYEILSVEWVDPQEIKWNLSALEQKAIILAKEEFDRERIAAHLGSR